MNKEEEHFHNIADKLSKEYKFVKIGKIISSHDIIYIKKIAFYYKKEITLKLGKEFELFTNKFYCKECSEKCYFKN